MFNSIFNGISSSIDLGSMLICVFCSIFLGLIVAFTYKTTSRYSKNFLITLSMLPDAIEYLENNNYITFISCFLRVFLLYFFLWKKDI